MCTVNCRERFYTAACMVALSFCQQSSRLAKFYGIKYIAIL